LSQNTGTDLKNSLQPVSLGCIENDLGQLIRPLCPNAPNPGDIVQRSAQDFSLALDALQGGKEVAIGGVTGTLTLSPAGDRLETIGIWKVASDGPVQGFFVASRVDPFATGAFWEK